MLLTGILKDAAVSDARIRLFANHVQRFNQDMDSAWLTTSFETSEPSDLKYDPYAMQDLWAEKEGSFPGWNCRITAFGLFGDFVSFHGDISADAGAGTLFMDYETLDEDQIRSAATARKSSVHGLHLLPQPVPQIYRFT